MAIDTGTGVGAQAAAREEALAQLDDAVALHRVEAGEGTVLQDLGIDSDEV